MAEKKGKNIWLELQQEVLELILQKLVLKDYLNCGQVCRYWRNVVVDALAIKGRCPPAPQFPFLLVLPSPDRTIAELSTLLELSQDTLYTISTDSGEGSFDDVGSVEGWLVFRKSIHNSSGSRSCCLHTFFNPVSGEKHNLPPLFPRMKIDSSVRTETKFYSTPSSPKFVTVISFVACIGSELKQRLEFCKLNDKSWTSINTLESRSIIIHDFVIIGGCKIYGIVEGVFDFVIVFYLRDATAITCERLVLLDPKPDPMVSHEGFRVRDVLRFITDCFSMMVTDPTREEEVLLVLHLHDKVFNGERKSFGSTKGFRVFKLDISECRWMEIDNLDGRFLVLDCKGIRVMSTTVLDCPENFTGGNCGNCVFFCLTNNNRLDPYVKRGLGVFSLTDKRIRNLPLHPFLKVVSGTCSWFTPSLW
ncbi:uncharacterized protein LOC113866799 [Abrus precatorius]|uniref:Uncharacterized protein LOC113866799 n=1 Tax=Abrus precatorius TaxID=3816 RepID=A0A8B8LPQ1_ABRPR|nr:uncharacterized protein LOC113866799 [Abrus precatorius]